MFIVYDLKDGKMIAALANDNDQPMYGTRGEDYDSFEISDFDHTKSWNIDISGDTPSLVEFTPAPPPEEE